MLYQNLSYQKLALNCYIFIKKVKNEENGNASDDALKLIVKISEGSVRDALSLLDRALLSLDKNKELDLTSAQKTNLENALAPYKVASITPVVVDAETTSLILGITIMFDTSATTYTGDQIASLVATTVSNYNTSDLQSFNKPFRHSALLGLIDNSDNSILNNTTVVTMAQYYTPTLGTSNSKILNFANPFYSLHSGHR